MATPLSSILLLTVYSVISVESSKTPVFDGSGTFSLNCDPTVVPLISGTIYCHVEVSIEAESDEPPYVPYVPLNVTVHSDIITPEYIDRPFDEDSKSDEDSKTSYRKTIPVTFSVSSTLHLQQHPIPVTASASLNKTSLHATANVNDNRVGIGFLSQIQPCYPNKSCDLSLKVSRNTSLAMSISLVDSKNKTVNHTSFTVNGDGSQHTQITTQEVGDFTAILSVRKEDESLVVWSGQSLQVHVTTDRLENLTMANHELQVLYRELKVHLQIVKDKYLELEEKYSKLEHIVNELETHAANSACKDVTCSKSHMCRDGKCICIKEEEGCHNYFPCDYCGSRGLCEGSLDDISNYTCTCYNKNVTGKNCSECKADYCLKRGNCTVSAEGQPTCQCDVPYIGQKCEGCDDTFCDGLGSCTVSKKGKPTCPVCIVGDRKSCNGGVCIDGGLRCNCTNTSNIGPTCDVERTSPTDNCSPPCLNDGRCTSENGSDYVCTCPLGFSGDSCEDLDIPKPPTLDKDKDMQTEAAPTPQSNSTLLYGALALFIAVLVVCVAAYLAYHNREKIFELFGVKKETVVEMAMRSRTKKNKGYKKLPTSIHDTLTHED